MQEFDQLFGTIQGSVVDNRSEENLGSMMGEPRIPSKLDNYEDTGERLGFLDKRDYSSPAKDGSRRRDHSKFSQERSNSNKSRLPNSYLQSESPSVFNFQN